MYTHDNNKRFTIAGIEKGLCQMAAKRLSSEWTTRKAKESLKQASDWVYRAVAEKVYQIAKNLRAQKKGYKRSVWAVCEKSPRNLDSGRHYYSVYFIDGDSAEKFWPHELWPLFRMDSQDRDRQMPKYVFSSGAIGMSRLLDATDGMFYAIRELTGVYAQIDVI